MISFEVFIPYPNLEGDAAPHPNAGRPLYVGSRASYSAAVELAIEYARKYNAQAEIRPDGSTFVLPSGKVMGATT